MSDLIVPPDLKNGSQLKQPIEFLPQGRELTVDLGGNSATWVAGTVIEFARKKGYEEFVFFNGGDTATLQEYLEAMSKRHRVTARVLDGVTGPVEDAERAWRDGLTVFQTEIPLDVQSARASIGRVSQTGRSISDAGGILTAIEAHGWRLAHAGFVFRPSGTVSRDRLLGSGQQESVSGATVGIYVFTRPR